MFKNKVVLWLLSHGLKTAVLNEKRLKTPLQMKDPVWVIEEICKVGGDDYRKELDNPKAKLELMALVDGFQREVGT